ncbi:hypothetical protein MNEG_3476 [Monoraphidium neglectum]|uniref:Uncharacterized protein n=1 Tax=Monoraphidium neglectum TaxID=145388 RepID=A0A0D2LCK3_9CHLO|nr:hypothetical protein MNEG_3476 [Monoraphidium neglectum]KIZ04484.1 hypothetical protein MNEG_3476 [Monoraphidium neglectum]|eukprot:XP_013903503.1 hypothetical protein MNEG_3476 [Monoraphidium neglectum]
MRTRPWEPARFLVLFITGVWGVHGANAQWKLQCADPAIGDAVVSYSPLYGRANMSDSAWNDQTWAFAEYGPITALELYHSGSGWHDPFIGWHAGGELKGVRPTYGNATNDDALLLGARRPHQPASFALQPGEKIVRVELQHDSVMRWMAFVTQLGRRFEWGFKDRENATSDADYAPRDGAYLAAVRGYEGKQLPKALGGYKKRYIIQIGFAWAMPTCGGYKWREPQPEQLQPQQQAAFVNSLFDSLVSYGDDGGSGGGETAGSVAAAPGPKEAQARSPAPALAPVVRLPVAPPPVAAAPPPATARAPGPSPALAPPQISICTAPVTKQRACGGDPARL